MVKVKFITKNSNVLEMDYSDVNNFCKDIALMEENVLEFNEFKNSYSCFEPYFDFVTFRLGYVFCVGGFTLVRYYNPKTDEEALYDASTSSLDYEEIIQALEEMISFHLDNFPVLKINKCSDKDLNIELIDDTPKRSFLIDTNLVGYISLIGDKQGSHPVTANTILNQLLINDKGILDNLIRYKDYYGFSDGTGLNFLEEVLGYIRATKHSLTYNGVVSSDRQKKFIDRARDDGYIVEDRDVDMNFMTDKKRLF